MSDLRAQFGDIDVYLFDQLLRGRIAPGMRLLDAGCGSGRNLVYLMRSGCEIFGCDASPEAVAHVRALSASLGTSLPAENFQVAKLEAMPFAADCADVVICNSVLHFAQDEDHFHAMIAELWRVLRPGGMLFCRLGSQIGMEFEQLRGGLFRMPDGAEWYLVDEETLLDLTAELDGVLVDPLKTTVVQDYRCMTTWVVRKRH